MPEAATKCRKWFAIFRLRAKIFKKITSHPEAGSFRQNHLRAKIFRKRTSHPEAASFRKISFRSQNFQNETSSFRKVPKSLACHREDPEKARVKARALTPGSPSFTGCFIHDDKQHDYGSCPKRPNCAETRIGPGTFRSSV